MKIAIDCRMYGKSGIGVYLKGILNHLLCIDHDYLLIGYHPDLFKYKNKKVTLLVYNAPIFSLKEQIHFPYKEVNKCDIFYSPNYNIPIGIKIPILSTIHDIIFLDIKGIVPLFSKIIRWIFLKYAILKSNRILTVSEFSKERIKTKLKTKKNITITYNGVIHRSNNLDKTNKLLNYTPFILFIGNIKKHKGLDILIKAYNMALRKGEQRNLVIVGGSENFKTKDDTTLNILKSRVKKIYYLNKINDSEIVTLIKNSECLIQPSLYEGFGIPPLEAMHLGTPTIISDIPVFKELYSDFPVHFFNSGNSQDLCDKILNTSSERINLSPNLKDKYCYKKSANIILNEFFIITNTQNK